MPHGFAMLFEYLLRHCINRIVGARLGNESGDCAYWAQTHPQILLIWREFHENRHKFWRCYHSPNHELRVAVTATLQKSKKAQQCFFVYAECIPTILPSNTYLALRPLHRRLRLLCVQSLSLVIYAQPEWFQ